MKVYRVEIGGEGFATESNTFNAYSEFDAMQQAIQSGYVREGMRVFRVWLE
jgi:hypothetical protein